MFSVFVYHTGAPTAVGVGCYPKAAMLNHSCQPNCIVQYDGTSLQVRAACAVAAGEELCHSYVDLSTPTRLRQRVISNRYGFSCQCARCLGVTYEGEDVDFLMEAQLGWPQGDAFLEGDLVLEEERIQAAIQQTEVDLARAEALDDIAEATAMTNAALQVRRELCHPLSLQRFHAETAAFELAIRRGDILAAREHSRHSLAFYEMALSHVPWHPTLSLERLQLAGLECQLEEYTRARSLLTKALSALLVTHGDSHPLTKQIMAMRKQLSKNMHM